jgi:hypothetical protein
MRGNPAARSTSQPPLVACVGMRVGPVGPAPLPLENANTRRGSAAENSRELDRIVRAYPPELRLRHRPGIRAQAEDRRVIFIQERLHECGVMPQVFMQKHAIAMCWIRTEGWHRVIRVSEWQFIPMPARAPLRRVGRPFRWQPSRVDCESRQLASARGDALDRGDRCARRAPVQPHAVARS